MIAFGINVSPAVTAGCDPIAEAQEAEALGFDFVSVNDHIHGGGPRLEAWTMLAWIAASTSRLRIVPRVLGVPYRPPALVAKMAETFDRLSEGRIVLGLGAGSGEQEYGALGLPTRPLKDRITGLEEAIEIIRGVWAATPYSFHGQIYGVDGAEIEPKPSHAVPIWLGTVGPRGLDMTGRLADGWIPSVEYAPPDQARAMIGRITAAAAASGRDASAFEYVYNVEVQLGNPKEPEPHVLTGSAAGVAERLVAFVQLGFTGINLVPTGEDTRAQTLELAHDVIPAVRAALS